MTRKAYLRRQEGQGHHLQSPCRSGILTLQRWNRSSPHASSNQGGHWILKQFSSSTVVLVFLLDSTYNIRKTARPTADDDDHDDDDDDDVETPA